MLAASVISAGALGSQTVRAQTRPTIDVRKLGAFGNGKLPDLVQLREAIRRAADSGAGATVYFPPGEYYLGATDDAPLLTATRLRNVRFIGDRATLSCRSTGGKSSMLVLAGCRDIAVEGLSFRDYGLDRENVSGAAAVRLTDDGTHGCENIEVKHCRFDSVLTATVCRTFDDRRRARIRGLTLTDLTVSHSCYGFSFQEAGDDATGRQLRSRDVWRSYFPYGISNHDMELETSDNATGYTDVLIKCYDKDTSSVHVKLKCRAKRGGDAIVALDHQNKKGVGVIQKVTLDLDVDDADCKLDAVVLIRSLSQQGRNEAETQNRWDNISIDGDVRICDRTQLVQIATVGKTPGKLHIGSTLARNSRLPRNFPGFVVSRA